LNRNYDETAMMKKMKTDERVDEVMNERINGMTELLIGQTNAPISVVNEGHAGPKEFQVLALHSPDALELEEKLNYASGDGWSLFQIIQQKENLLLVFFRQPLPYRMITSNND
jgi:hypothetical protein